MLQRLLRGGFGEQSVGRGLGAYDDSSDGKFYIEINSSPTTCLRSVAWRKEKLP